MASTNCGDAGVQWCLGLGPEVLHAYNGNFELVERVHDREPIELQVFER